MPAPPEQSDRNRGSRQNKAGAKSVLPLTLVAELRPHTSSEATISLTATLKQGTRVQDRIDSDFESSLQQVVAHIQSRHDSLNDLPVLPTPQAVAASIASLPPSLPQEGLGTKSTTTYLIDQLLPGILQGQNGNRYFGFVVGGVTPAAQLAEILGGSYDENVQATLAGNTASTAIEQRTLELILDLIGIERSVYMGRTLTTGATGSNILGLACARDHLYANSPHLPEGYSFSQSGPPRSPTLPDPPIILLTLHPHYSILKAAALVGLGSGPNVIQTIPADPKDELSFEIPVLEARLKAEKEVGRGVIVVWGMGEVNTGGFGAGLDDVAGLCKEYGAWLHIDAAFGGFAGLAPELSHLTRGMDQADSVTLDAHKWLNVPYDCGIFFTKRQSSLPGIFAPPLAQTPAYLQTVPTTSSSSISASNDTAPPSNWEQDPSLVPSPLYVNIENSRRFRALPLFASLLSLGREGYESLIQRNLEFARRVAEYFDGQEEWDLLNPSSEVSFPSTRSAYVTRTPGEVDGGAGGVIDGVRRGKPIIPLNIVLFRGTEKSKYPPSDPSSSSRLATAINSTRQIYVTGTRWRGGGAVRLAVSNWRTGLGGDEEFEIVRKVLQGVMA